MKYFIGLIFFISNFHGFSQCLEGNCIDGYGKFECSCGYIYEGEFENGQKVYGTLTKEDLIYTGQFKDDVAEGQGVIKFIDSTWYEGSFINNFPEGYGKFHFANGITYTGEMFEGKFKGLGVLSKPLNDSTMLPYLIGSFKNDMVDGYGMFIDSVAYFGACTGGYKTGFGLQICTNKEIMIGKYKKDKLTDRVLNSVDSTSMNFISENYTIGKLVFKSHGNIREKNLIIESVNENGQLVKIGFSDSKSQFFYSTFGTYPIGLVIDFQGQIYSGYFDDKQGNFIQTEQLYTN